MLIKKKIFKKLQGTIIVCKSCKRKKKYFCKNLCYHCYNRIWQKRKWKKLSKRKQNKIISDRKIYKKKYRKGVGRFIEIKHNADIRKLEFSLTKEEYFNLVDNNCYSCGFRLRSTGGGLDRINNSKGYIKNNVLPCCAECNCARNDNFTVKEMIEIIGPAIRKIKLARLRKLKKRRKSNGKTIL